MKVVIFCGGLGMRLRAAGENIPKPMVRIGDQPILWHLMRYYAHYGHKDFILCLGYRADVIKKYFLEDAESHDVSDWRITYADTGVDANVGERLLAAREHVEHEDAFLANYADGLTDMDLPAFIAKYSAAGKVASMVCARPNLSFHTVVAGSDGVVQKIQPITETGLRINGGYFLFKREIFDYMRPGEELVREPFDRLIAQRQLLAHAYDGFFFSMDTFKDKQQFDDLDAKGVAPWKVWRAGAAGAAAVPR